MSVQGSSGKAQLEKKVFLFPGQGIQELGMGSEVLDISSATKAVWDCASDTSGIDVRKLCIKGPMTKLTKTLYQQLAVTTVNVAMYEALKERYDIADSAYAGHSAGEYSALYAAGAFDLETVFKAIFARASIMQKLAESSKGMMYVIKNVAKDTLAEYLEQVAPGTVQIANDNSPKQQVISGQAENVKTIAAELQRQGYELIKLPVNGAWHSHLMIEGVQPLQQILSGLNIRTPGNPVYMNLKAAPVYEKEKIVTNLANHLISTVRWRETMFAFYEAGYRDFVEIGSKKILGHMLSGHYPMGEELAITHFSHWFAENADA